MMISFATCDREKAKVFIKDVYPNYIIDWQRAEPLLALIDEDVIRIEDPMMQFHNRQIRIICGKKFQETDRERITAAHRAFSGALVAREIEP